jgi:hypothetical protein
LGLLPAKEGSGDYSTIRDVSPFVPELVAAAVAAEEAEDA